MKTIETQVADTILQTEEDIKIGNNTYCVAPPSVATLILVSAAISRLPSAKLNDNNIIGETLAIAKDCAVLGEIAATLIIGAKHINEEVKTQQIKRKSFLGGLFHTTYKSVITETRKEKLCREILEGLTPRDLHNLIAKLLLKMQVADFFGITTFLTEINLIRPTKVVTEATASGH